MGIEKLDLFEKSFAVDPIVVDDPKEADGSDIEQQTAEKKTQMYELLAVSNDLHRKFAKANERGQHSAISSEDELDTFLTVRGTLDYKQLKNTMELRKYFSLFTDKPENKAQVAEQVHEGEVLTI